MELWPVVCWVWRIPLFFVLLALLWGPVALIVYGLGAWSSSSELTSVLALLSLYGCFIVHAWFWGRWGHRWLAPFRIYGFVLGQRFLVDMAFAIAAGLALVGSLFSATVVLGWADFYPTSLTWIALEGLAVGLGVGIAEELLFRGWLLSELRTGLSRPWSIVGSSVLFAIAHFIKPWSEILSTSPQFLGLCLLGLILGSWRYLHRPRLRRSHLASAQQRPFSSLGLPVGLHAGLVWGYYMVDVGDLIIPSGRVPEWITGIHGNPLSSALGVGILACVATVSWLKLPPE